MRKVSWLTIMNFSLNQMFFYNNVNDYRCLKGKVGHLVWFEQPQMH